MRFLVTLVLLGALTPLAHAEDKLQFDVQQLATEGEVRHVEAADLDGDGKLDLVVATVLGEDEKAQRLFAIFWNQGDSFNAKPDLVLPAPADLCVYDLADVDGKPGAELLVVAPNGVRAVSFVGRAPSAPKELLTQPTLFMRAPHEQLARFKLLHPLGANQAPVLLVPGLGSLGVYVRAGDAWTRKSELQIDVEESVDVPPREERDRSLVGLPAFSVSTRFPVLHVVDLNGDGLPDLVMAHEDEVRAFVQNADGTFPPKPTLVHAFNVRGKEKGSDNPPQLHISLMDVDGDGRADAIITKQVNEGITSATTTVFVYLGTPEGFRDKADQVIHSDGASFAGVQLVDLTGDGKPDLVMPSVKIGLFAIVRMLTSKSIKVVWQLYPMGPDRKFAAKPTADRDMVLKLDLEGHTDLQAIDMEGDYDGDGVRDLAFGTDADELSLFKGGAPGELFSDSPVARVPVRAYGQLLAVALDGGKRTDVVLWYPGTRGHKTEIAVVRSKLK
ncbi:MAG: VCBS repeat-containing protein [Deltaproteobacteria bacterium]|nr:VCBS repeat-containing protein [Deltaproteobacteria bacterium]